MNNKIPKELAERQEKQRQNTVNIVRDAIEELSAEGHKITIKLLMGYTGFSRSTFAKQHIRNILMSMGVTKQEKNKNAMNCETTSDKNYNEEVKVLKDRIKRLMTENKELKKECELLRGEVFLLMQQK